MASLALSLHSQNPLCSVPRLPGDRSIKFIRSQLLLSASVVFFFFITAELYLSPCRAFLPHLTPLKLLLKISPQGTSLVGQWLRLHVPNAEGPGSILVRELDPICCK